MDTIKSELKSSLKAEWESTFGPLRLTSSLPTLLKARPVVRFLHKEREKITTGSYEKKKVSLSDDMLYDISDKILESTPKDIRDMWESYYLAYTEEVEAVATCLFDNLVDDDPATHNFVEAMDYIDQYGVHGIQLTSNQAKLFSETSVNIKAGDVNLPHKVFTVELPYHIRKEFKNKYSIDTMYIVMYKDSHCLRYSCLSKNLLNTVNLGICENLDYDASGLLSSTLSFATEIEGVIDKDADLTELDEQALQILRRIATNTVLMINNFKSSQVPLLREKKSQKKFSSTPKKQVRILQNIKLSNKVTKYINSNRIGSMKRPHWRRGHWRRQRVGVGMVDTKMIFVPPCFIHKEAVSGNFSRTGTNYKKP